MVHAASGADQESEVFIVTVATLLLVPPDLHSLVLLVPVSETSSTATSIETLTEQRKAFRFSQPSAKVDSEREKIR